MYPHRLQGGCYANFKSSIAESEGDWPKVEYIGTGIKRIRNVSALQGVEIFVTIDYDPFQASNSGYLLAKNPVDFTICQHKKWQFAFFSASRHIYKSASGKLITARRFILSALALFSR